MTLSELKRSADELSETDRAALAEFLRETLTAPTGGAARPSSAGIDAPAGTGKMTDMTEEGPISEPAAQVRISPVAFLRSMAVLLWDAFRQPHRTTEIDLTTGRVVSRS